MSRRNRMAVLPRALENPEHDLDLLTRGPEPEEQDEQPEEIIESAATAMVPPHSRIDAPPGICHACFGRVVKAATLALDRKHRTSSPRRSSKVLPPLWCRRIRASMPHPGSVVPASSAASRPQPWLSRPRLRRWIRARGSPPPA